MAYEARITDTRILDILEKRLALILASETSTLSLSTKSKAMTLTSLSAWALLVYLVQGSRRPQSEYTEFCPRFFCAYVIGGQKIKHYICKNIHLFNTLRL